MSCRISVDQGLDPLLIHLLAQCQLLLVHVNDIHIVNRLDLNHFQVSICSHTHLEISLISNGINFLSGVFILEIKPVIAAQLGIHTLRDLAGVLEFRNPEHESDKVLESQDVA